MSTNLEDSIVLISSSIDQLKYKDVIGTGFIIYREEKEIYLLTCTHVVEAVGGKASVQIYGKQATVTASSKVNAFDLSVLKVKHENLIKCPVLKLDFSCQATTSVNGVGYYLHSTLKNRSLEPIIGYLQHPKYRENQDTRERVKAWEINLTKGQFKKGYSGSPVADQDSGCVIGVVTDMEKGGQTGQIISVKALEFICPQLIEKLTEKPERESEEFIRRERLPCNQPKERQLSRYKKKQPGELPGIELPWIQSTQKLPWIQSAQKLPWSQSAQKPSQLPWLCVEVKIRLSTSI